MKVHNVLSLMVCCCCSHTLHLWEKFVCSLKVHIVLRISNATTQITALYVVKLSSGDEMKFGLEVHVVVVSFVVTLSSGVKVESS